MPPVRIYPLTETTYIPYLSIHTYSQIHNILTSCYTVKYTYLPVVSMRGMDSPLLAEAPIRVSVSNIGGIDEASVTIPPGVSVLTGRNATNRTSFVQALMAGLGSEHCSLKGDTTSGTVTLELDGREYTRTLTRENGRVVFGGEPYLDDTEVADLYAFLLERNDARQAIARGDDLRSVIMQPVDTDAITDEIAACKRNRDDIEAELERLAALERDLPDLERTRTQLREEYDETAAALETARTRLDEHETDVEQSRSDKAALEAAFDRVREARSTLEDLAFEIETEESTIAELHAERDELEAELEELDVPDASTERLAGRIQELRERKRGLSTQASQLGDVIRFNEEARDDDGPAVTLETETNDEIDDLTDALQATETVTCWTCGSSVASTQIDTMVDTLRTLRSDLLDSRSAVQQQINEVREERDRITTARADRDRTQRQLATTTEAIDTAEDRLTALQTQHTAQEETVAELETTADEIDVGDHDDVLEHHRTVTGLEVELERLESDLDDIEATIADHEAELDARDQLEADRENLTTQLEALRTRIQRLEADAVEAFNTHMETVLGLLEYHNLDRIWIERREVTVREGRRTVDTGRFDLHVIRSGADGVAYEDTVEHLSESEREVTGLVFALAGYLVHEVYTEVPVIVLDSLEAIDADRIARVIEYLEDHATYLVAALLPEDAEALSDSHTYISEIA